MTISEQLAEIKQEFDFIKVEISSLRVELTRVLSNQQADNEANKKKLTNSGNYLSDLLGDSHNWNPTYKPTRNAGQP